MSVLAEYIRGAGVLTAQAVVQRFLGALTSIVLARGLGTTGFGAYSAVLTTASSAYGIVRLGVDAAIHVYAARGKQDARADRLTGELLGAGLGILATAGFIAAVLTALGAEWLAVDFFQQPDLVRPLRFAGVLTALQCLSQFGYATLAGFQNFVAYAKLMIINSVFVLALTGGGMWLYGVEGALSGYGVAQAILAVSLGHAATRTIREHGIRIAYSRLLRAVSTLMRLGIPFYMAGLVSVPVIYYLQGLLSRSAGVDALGFLRVIAAITAIIAFIPTSVAAATTSTLTRTRVEADASGSKLFDYAFLNLKLVWYLTTMMAMALAMLVPILVNILFGAQYESAVKPGTLALFSVVLSSTAGAAGSLFFAMERSGFIFGQSILQSLALAFTGVSIIPALGVLGYVAAELGGNLIGLSFILVAAMRIAGRHRGNGPHTQAFVLCALAGLLSVLITQGTLATLAPVPTLLLLMVLLSLGMFRFGLSAWEQSIVRRVASSFAVGKD